MATKLNYTTKEFLSILTEIRDALKSELPESNDFLESNVGRWLIDTYAAIGDMLAYNIDRQAAECYIDTAEIRQNVLSLLRVIGFQAYNPIPENVGVTFTLTTSPTHDVVIPQYTKLKASKRSIPFVVKDTLVIGGTPYWQPSTAKSIGDRVRSSSFQDPQFEVDGFVGSTPYLTGITEPTWPLTVGSTVIDNGIKWKAIPASFSSTTTAIQGVWRTLSFISTGTKFQRYLLNSNTIAEGMFRVFVSGTEWSLAEDNSLIGSASTDQVYRYLNLPDKRVMIEFGDGIDGQAPAKGNDIAISYLETMNVQGRISSNEIDTIVDTIGVPVTVTNNSPSLGGSDFEPIPSARYRYPTAFRTLRRAVTLSDYEAITRLSSSVLQVKAADFNLDTEIPFSKVLVYVIGNGGVTSQSLNNEVYEFLKTKRTLATVLEVRSPTQVQINVSGNIRIYRTFREDEVLQDVLTTIDNFFTLSPLDTSEAKIGGTLSYSRLLAKIQAVDGVATTNILWAKNDDRGTTNDIVMNYFEYPRLATVNVTSSGLV